MSRAYQVTSFSSPPAFTEITETAPAQGEVTLKIEACGLNFADLLMQTGRYQDTPELPFTQGMEVVGTITQLGDEVLGFRVGDRVMTVPGSGGLAETGNFAAKLCTKVPESMSSVDAAAFPIAYGTSHMALDYKANLQPGETLLVTGASGGVGLTAVELGKLMGARVIGVARGAAKMEVATKAGADHVFDSDDPDLLAKLKELGGVDVVYEAIGGDLFKTAMRATKPDGRILAIGFAGGDVPQIPANHLLVKNITVIGFYWGGYKNFNPTPMQRSFEQLLKWYEEGKLRPHVSHVFPLDQAQEALETLRDRKSTGKVVVAR